MLGQGPYSVSSITCHTYIIMSPSFRVLPFAAWLAFGQASLYHHHQSRHYFLPYLTDRRSTCNTRRSDSRSFSVYKHLVFVLHCLPILVCPCIGRRYRSNAQRKPLPSCRGFDGVHLPPPSVFQQCREWMTLITERIFEIASWRVYAPLMTYGMRHGSEMFLAWNRLKVRPV